MRESTRVLQVRTCTYQAARRGAAAVGRRKREEDRPITPATTKSSNNYYQPDHPGGPSERGHESMPNIMQQTMRWRQVGHGTDWLFVLAATSHASLQLFSMSSSGWPIVRFLQTAAPTLGTASGRHLLASTNSCFVATADQRERER